MILNSYEQLPILFDFCFESLKWITAHPEVEGIISLPENCEISNRLGMFSKKIKNFKNSKNLKDFAKFAGKHP